MPGEGVGPQGPGEGVARGDPREAAEPRRRLQRRLPPQLEGEGVVVELLVRCR